MIMQQSKILSMCIGDYSKDPRPKRMINFFLENKFDLYICSDVKKDSRKNFKLDNLGLRNNYDISSRFKKLFLLIVRKFFPFNSLKNKINEYIYGYHVLKHDIDKQNYDFIICHDIYLLPLAVSLKNNNKKSKILFDAREFYPGQFEDSFLFNLFEKKERERICKTFFHNCDEIITVSDSISRKYYELFDKKPKVFMSAPVYQDLKVRRTNNRQIKIVHHGVANKNRKIENMIKIVSQSDERFSLDLYLTGSKKYIGKLRSMIDDQRIKIKEPVEFDELVNNLNLYDIGLFYVEPSTENLKYCLPNKLFEFIQARLAVMIGPSEEMKKIIENYDCGFVCNEFTLDSCIKLLNSLSAESIDIKKANSNKASKELNFYEQVKNLNFFND